MLDDEKNPQITSHSPNFFQTVRGKNIQHQSAVCPLSGYYLFCWFFLSRLTDMFHLCGSSPRCPTQVASSELNLTQVSRVNMFFEFSSAWQCAGILEQIKGDWGVQRLLGILPWLRHQHCVPTAVYLTVSTRGRRMLTEHREPEGDSISFNEMCVPVRRCLCVARHFM